MKLRRNRLTTAVQLSFLLALPMAAVAQDAPQAQEAVTLDRVQVTGTRIKKAEIEGQVPVQTVTREDIERTGLNSLGDIVQALTASGSALNTRFNSSGNFGFPPDGSGVGAGSAQVDLRHLGAKRVLVLVDGMRWVNESSASGVGAATDLNTIPLAIVDRIEVLEDGASALYGSDAIAGVVNIITRRDFDGASVSVQYGEYEAGDGETTKADLAWGWNGERSNLFLGASYTEQERVSSADREQSRFPVPGTGVTFGSSATPTGRFVFRHPGTGATYNITPNTGASNPRFDATQTGCTRTDDYHCFTDADRFNFSPFNLLVTPSERAGLFGQFRFDLSENSSWYVKALYNRRESVNQAAPEPIFLGPSGGTGNPLADNIFISRNNPFNPFGIDLDARLTTPPAQRNLFLIGRRPIEGGPRVFMQEVDTWYVGTGFEGIFDVGGSTWFWDVNLAHSDNSAEQTNYGSYNIRNIGIALGDPAVCAATPGCTPLNIFGGPGTITQAMLAWIQPVVRDRSANKLTQFTANLSGDLFSLPAGPLSFAAGVEHRRYEGWYQPDPLTVAGFYNGVPSKPTSGEYDVSELYTEFNVPLMADSAWGKKLDLSIAGRYSDYSTFGGEFTGKLGLRWQVADELLLRTTFAEGFRAPSIGELFGSDSRFDAVLADPCSEPLADPSLLSNCRALGVPAGFQQANPQISVTTGGNRNLQPETADSFTAGLVWSPGFLEDSAVAERVDVEVTFYRHTITGAIQAVDAQTQLNLCVRTMSPLYCDGITRASTGAINGFNNRLTNLGVIKTDGWDVDLFWTLPESRLGKLRVDWRNTFVTRYEAYGAGGQRQPQRPGVEVNNSAIPEWTSTFVVDWSRENWFGSWTVRHISELREACGRAINFPVCSNPALNRNVLPETTYHDLQLGYNFEWLRGLKVTAGVNNAFDKDPPICLSCSLNGYDASTYDIPGGRFWYLRADLRF
ncbi:TonB-dependent receptor [Vulcaniibacterium gelatinicum]|uniref:TonB-dependent receptor n=1 Tax=Vulcaniibacterium gelatinicum TaxID=2598725 RepID=UPI0011C9BBEE|nr:TonB-dependent receptor [Vulcaniibacterium gelatinicum]